MFDSYLELVVAVGAVVLTFSLLLEEFPAAAVTVSPGGEAGLLSAFSTLFSLAGSTVPLLTGAFSSFLGAGFSSTLFTEISYLGVAAAVFGFSFLGLSSVPLAGGITIGYLGGVGGTMVSS